MSQAPIKRVKYFTSQFLEASDFQLEQNYHINMRRRGHRALFFSAGILDDGFRVSIKSGDATKIVIAQGIGLDGDGREIVVLDDMEVTVPVPTPPMPANGMQPYRVALAYGEQEADQQTVDTDFSDNTRYLEQPQVSFFIDGAIIDGRTWIVIGGISVNASGSTTTSTPATPVRVHASARVFGSLEVGSATPVPNARLHVGEGALAISQDATLAHADAAIHVWGSTGGFDRLLQMSPLGASKDGLNILASMNAASQELWWAWGVTANDKWRIRKGTGLGGDDGLTIDASGNAGFGQSGPRAKLDVAGNAVVDGTLGVGIAVPVQNAKMHVMSGALAISQDTSLALADAAIHVSGTAGTFGRLLQMGPLGASKDGLNLLASRNAGSQEQWWSWGVTAGDKWRIRKGTDLSGTDGLTLDAAGNAGIGKADPQAKLHVAGNETLEGNLSLGGPNPAFDTGFRNVLTPKNVVKAWGVIETGPNPRLLDGFNIVAPDPGAWVNGSAVIEFTEGLTDVVCITGSFENSATMAVLGFGRYSNAPNGKKLDVYAYEFMPVTSTTGWQPAQMRPIPWKTSVYRFSVIVMGAQ